LFSCEEPVFMKPRVLIPILLAAMGLTALMLLFMSSAGLVAGLPADAEAQAEVDSVPPEAVTATTAVSLPWQAVAPGIDYVQLNLQNPINNVYIARMDRSVLSTTLDTGLGSGALASGLEPVSRMAARYDQAINYWIQAPFTTTWGNRNDVAVAINGSYYSYTTTLFQSGMVQSGWYVKRFDDLGGGSGFAWKLNRSAFIGECVLHRPDRQLVKYADDVTQQFQGINVKRTDDILIVYTPQYDGNTGTDDTGAEVLVELSRPLLIIPTPGRVTGTVRAIYTDTGSTPIPFDSVVLSAHGNARDTMLAHVQVGDVVGISQEITSYEFDCEAPLSLDWSKTYASLSGGFYFLKNGIVRHFYDDQGATDKLPRTAIVFNNNYIYFVVVDGRDPYQSQGMTIDELALFARDTLSATYGISQDGGGSSTMVVNGQVVNNTTCNNKCYFRFLPVVGRGSSEVTLTVSDQPLMQTQAVQPDEVDAATWERYVANGIMMVVVEPMQASTTFSPTQAVKTSVLVDLRLGPGSNYAAPWDIAKDTPGVIVSHALNGVLAKGSYWWKVDFNGIQGWVKESDLAPIVEGWR
jgi:hypothetical protein